MDTNRVKKDDHGDGDGDDDGDGDGDDDGDGDGDDDDDDHDEDGGGDGRPPADRTWVVGNLRSGAHLGAWLGQA